MQVMRLNKNMTGNFSGKKIVTPIGLRPVFAFNAGRTKMPARDSRVLPSDYGELSYVEELAPVVGSYESEAISDIQKGFNGAYLELVKKGYKKPVPNERIYKNIAVAVSIKFQLNSTDGGSVSSLRLVTVGIDGGYLYLHPLQNGKGIALRTTFGSKTATIVNRDIVGELISLVVVFKGKDTFYTVNGKTFYSLALDDFKVDSKVTSMYLNASDTAPRTQELDIYAFDIYSSDKFSQEEVAMLWRNINS